MTADERKDGLRRAAEAKMNRLKEQGFNPVRIPGPQLGLLWGIIDSLVDEVEEAKHLLAEVNDLALVPHLKTCRVDRCEERRLNSAINVLIGDDEDIPEVFRPKSPLVKKMAEELGIPVVELPLVDEEWR